MNHEKHEKHEKVSARERAFGGSALSQARLFVFFVFFVAISSLAASPWRTTEPAEETP
jgi:hypothetical protein